jgi:hypothetical protein
MDRPPTPPSSRSKLFVRAGWFLALGIGIFAAILDSQNFALKSAVRLEQTEIELAAVETQSLKQQLAAERILATRQISDLTRSKSAAGTVEFVLLTSPIASTADFAVVAWQHSAQRGMFCASQLPPLNPDDEYHLWIEGNGGQPVSAGTIAINPSQPTKVEFKAELRVEQAIRFVLTREHSGEAKVPSSAVLLSGTP